METNRRFLIFLTGEFPFGNGETFIENELPLLAQAFEEVIILVPPEAVNKPQRPIPQNVKAIPLKVGKQLIFRIKALISFPFWQGFLLDIKRKNLKTGFFNAFRNGWYNFTQALNVKNSIQNLMEQQKLKPEETILYSYWLDDKAMGASLFKKENPGIKSVSRAHRWDVYEEMHPIPFLPFRPWFGRYLDYLVFIAKQGMDYFEKQFPGIPSSKFALSYLGTKPLDLHKIKTCPKEFHYVSCSSLIPRKRVDLLARVLLESNRPLDWTHIGDGPEMDKIKKIAGEIENKGGKVTLMGNISNQAVREFYENKKVDLFVSVSESEGLPVSMMEAQSAGIPILATNVGGVNEIVMEGVTGWLLPPSPEPALVAEKISEIFEMKDAEKKTIRGNAYDHWQKNFNAEKNYPDFVNLLKNL